jgi:hypothetical protein
MALLLMAATALAGDKKAGKKPVMIFPISGAAA